MQLHSRLCQEGSAEGSHHVLKVRMADLAIGQELAVDLGLKLQGGLGGRAGS